MDHTDLVGKKFSEVMKCHCEQSFPSGFFFSKRLVAHKKHQNLDHYGEVFPRQYCVFDELKIACLMVPKAASSSILTALAQVCGVVLSANRGVHSCLQERIREGKLDESQSSYYKFAFVRNPFDRIVSCYREKILFTPVPWQPTPLYQYYYFSLPTNISFADFAGRVGKIPDPLADNHFKSQYALLYSEGALQVDHVGKMEDLDDEWKRISEKYQFDPSIIRRLNASKNKPGCHDDYRLYYTEPLAQLVYERYRRDVEVLGYERDYELLLDFIRGRGPSAAAAPPPTDPGRLEGEENPGRGGPQNEVSDA